MLIQSYKLILKYLIKKTNNLPLFAELGGVCGAGQRCVCGVSAAPRATHTSATSGGTRDTNAVNPPSFNALTVQCAPNRRSTCANTWPPARPTAG